MRYIQEDLTTTSFEVPNISWPLTQELSTKFDKFGACAKLIFKNEELVDIVYDEERKVKIEAMLTPSEDEILADKLSTIRQNRSVMLRAFDIYKSNLAYGLVTESAEEKAEIITWYQLILDITESVSVDSKIGWPQIPAGITKYLPSWFSPLSV